MKNKIQNIFLFAMLFLAEIMTAQGPDPDNLPGDANPTDAPIDQHLVWLLVGALVFVYYNFSKKLVPNSK
jgi:hypothetical protein